jgi:hypothetical protein
LIWLSSRMSVAPPELELEELLAALVLVVEELLAVLELVVEELLATLELVVVEEDLLATLELVVEELLATLELELLVLIPPLPPTPSPVLLLTSPLPPMPLLELGEDDGELTLAPPALLLPPDPTRPEPYTEQEATAITVPAEKR